MQQPDRPQFNPEAVIDQSRARNRDEALASLQLARTEQNQREIRQMVRDVYRAGDVIIQRHGLSVEPNYGTLAWVLRGRYIDARTPISWTSNSLFRAQILGSLDHPWLFVNFTNFADAPLEEGLIVFATQPKPHDALRPEDVSHGLSLAFLQELGASVPQTLQDWQERLREPIRVIFDEIPKPYSIEGDLQGSLIDKQEPHLIGLRLFPKDSSFPINI